MPTDTAICFQSCTLGSTLACAMEWLCAMFFCAAVLALIAMAVIVMVCLKRNMAICLKFWMYRHSFAIFILFFLFSLLFFICVWDKEGGILRWGPLIPVVGFGYFLSKLYSKETEILWDAIRDFNGKYGDGIKKFSNLYKQKNLIDYLNLCSEEYLLYTQGYVPPMVWKTWCQGMLEKMACIEKCQKCPKKCCGCAQKLCNKCIECKVRGELGNHGEKYYGLTWNKIEEGAGIKTFKKCQRLQKL